MLVTEKKNMWNQWNGIKPICSVVLTAATGDDNKTWARYTPSGRIELSIDNPDAYDAFEIGKAYFVDFTEAPMKEADEKK
jgi:hypothetical protein